MSYSENATKRLGLAVMLRAIHDYYCFAHKDEYALNVGESVKQSIAAGERVKHWVEYPSTGFALLCTIAGKKPKVFQKMMLEKMDRIDNGEELKTE